MANRLQKLNTQHRAAARLKAEGKTIAFISQELGVATRTLHVWFSDPLIKGEVMRLHERIEDVFIQRKAEVGLRALDELSSFSELPASKQVAVCQTCSWFGSTPSPHGTADPQCDGPWDVHERINESTKIEAIREILDRVDQTTKLRDRAEAQKSAGGDGQTNYLAIFQNADDAQIADLMRHWAQAGDEHTNGSGPGAPSLPAG